MPQQAKVGVVDNRVKRQLVRRFQRLGSVDESRTVALINLIIVGSSHERALVITEKLFVMHRRAHDADK